MIDVELSNIWGSVSLPDLLSGEKDLFDAHMQLRTNQPDGPDFLGWLNAPEGVMARAVLSIGKAAEQIAELCCNLDDMTPEAVGFAMEQLLSGGALDVFTTPIGMKKNRPGVRSGS